MLNKKAVNYVKNKNQNLFEQRHGPLNVLVKDPIENVNIELVFNHINRLLPEHFLSLIDVVYIGKFDFFEEREVNAMFVDDALYISNEQDNGEDMLDDIVHEFAHAVEKRYGEFIYRDGNIESEFLLKRKRLEKMLHHQGYDVAKHNFLNPEYTKEMDFFLLDDVGYDILNTLTVNMFMNPYSITSLSEYFATGFEQYYLENRSFLKTLCPYVYKKLIVLHDDTQEELL